MTVVGSKGGLGAWGLVLGGVLVVAPASAQPVQSFPLPEEEETAPSAAPPAPVPPAPVPPAAPGPPPRVVPPPVAPAPMPAVPQAPRPVQPPGVQPVGPPRPTGPGAGQVQLGFRPAVLPHLEGQPTPPGYRLETRPATGLIVGGLLTWGMAYAVGVAYAAAHDFEDGSGWVAAPLVGPWAAIGARDFGCELTGASVAATRREVDQCVDGALGEVEATAVLTADGILQAMGASLFLIGLASSESIWVRSDIAGLELRPGARGARFGLTLQRSF